MHSGAIQPCDCLLSGSVTVSSQVCGLDGEFGECDCDSGGNDNQGQSENGEGSSSTGSGGSFTGTFQLPWREYEAASRDFCVIPFFLSGCDWLGLGGDEASGRNKIELIGYSSATQVEALMWKSYSLEIKGVTKMPCAPYVSGQVVPLPEIPYG